MRRGTFTTATTVAGVLAGGAVVGVPAQADYKPAEVVIAGSIHHIESSDISDTWGHTESFGLTTDSKFRVKGKYSAQTGLWLLPRKATVRVTWKSRIDDTVPAEQCDSVHLTGSGSANVKMDVQPSLQQNLRRGEVGIVMIGKTPPSTMSGWHEEWMGPDDNRTCQQMPKSLPTYGDYVTVEAVATLSRKGNGRKDNREFSLVPTKTPRHFGTEHVGGVLREKETASGTMRFARNIWTWK